MNTKATQFDLIPTMAVMVTPALAGHGAAMVSGKVMQVDAIEGAPRKELV